MIGGEGEASPGWLNYGQWYKWAEENNAAMFLLEHRYYGQSKPTEDMSTENMRYLSSRQGLEDPKKPRSRSMTRTSSSQSRAASHMTRFSPVKCAVITSSSLFPRRAAATALGSSKLGLVPLFLAFSTTISSTSSTVKTLMS